ncbi:unnamed protein product [Dibothriocephalus latus]|uniref:Abnormal spindle-like microcephaly-associated protein ASH domain-containing protein n=1 Tax=Dibothriocephalus latus TaxID=60516 RepID=A0A3P6TP54_DIBLA|nr:unnamed protein product [Dibothriocephalus latus]
MKLRRSPHMFLAASGGWLELEIVFTPSAVVPAFLEQVSIAVAPVQMADIDTLGTIGNDEKFVWIPAFSVSGACKAMDIHLASSSMMFGTIVVGSQASRNLAVINRGDLGSRFQWDDKSFGPEGVKCLLENGASFQVNMTAICVPPTVAKDVLQFSCPVRATDTRGVAVANRTNSHWLLKPVVSGSEWSGAETFEVGPQETGYYEVTYHPLRMCTNGEKKSGTVFFPLPDGMGILHNLAGIAEPPKAMGKFNIEFRARESHEFSVDVPNWLPRPQRFTVTRMLVRPDKVDMNLSISGLEHIDVAGNSSKQYKLTVSAQKEGSTQLKVSNGYATLEFLPLLPGEYKGRLEVSSHDLGVFTHDLEFVADTAPLEEAISFEVHLGQSSSKAVRFSNLTKTKADFTCKQIADDCVVAMEPVLVLRVSAAEDIQGGGMDFISHGDFQCDKSITVAPGIEASLPVTFEPITIGETTATLTIVNAQAGEYVFPLRGTAKLPVPQGPIVVRNKETAHIVFKNVFPVNTEFFIHVSYQ